MKDLLGINRQEIHELVKAGTRQEQIEEERAQDSSDELNAKFNHDPLWDRRFWSIQHVRDCIDGKTFHWFWSPMKEVFELSQIMFMLLPIMAYVKGGGSISVWGIVWWILAFKCLVIGARHTIEWYHNWRFISVWKKAQKHQ